jgi:hypothetical protein
MVVVLAVVAVGLSIRPAGHAETAYPEWNVECGVDHYLADDPITSPGQPGAAAMNSFFGNTTTNANSTAASISAGAGSCDYIPSYDHSAYWVPSIMYTNADGSTGHYANASASNGFSIAVPAAPADPKFSRFRKVSRS